MTQGFDQGFQQQPQQQGFPPAQQPMQQPMQQPQQGGFQQGGFQQPGGFPQQGGFPGGGFAAGQQAPGNTPKAFTPDGPLTGFAPNPVSDFLKIKDYIGTAMLVRMYSIAVKTVNGRQTESLECDIILLHDAATRNFTQHNSQGLINSRIVGMGRRLMQSGTGVTAGVITLGEAQGGNQPPVQLANITDEAMAQFAYEVGVHVGWIPQEGAAEQAPATAPAATQAPAQGNVNPLG